LYRRHLSAGRARIAAILGGQVEVSSRGALVTDAAGDEYLDCGGYGVYLLGHCHARVIAAVRSQLDRHPMSTRLFLDGTQALAAEALAGVAPPGLDRVYFATSGADAVEAALKLARMHGKRRIVSAEGGFHGKTFGALSASGNPSSASRSSRSCQGLKTCRSVTPTLWPPRSPRRPASAACSSSRSRRRAASACPSPATSPRWPKRAASTTRC